MGKFLDLHKKLSRKTKAEINASITEIIRGRTKEILDMNRAQMQAGIKPDGSEIGRYQSEKYAELKGHDYVDLFLTGDMYYSMFVDVDSERIAIGADDEKTDNLLEKYGDFFGLTSENKRTLAQWIKKDIAAYYRELFSV